MSFIHKVGFIGAGQMCTALGGGMIRSGVLPASNVIMSDRNQDQLDKLKRTFEMNITNDNLEVVNFSDIIILAVKPHVIPLVLEQIRTSVTPAKLIISIAAGVTIQTIEDFLGTDVRIIRSMPNTPALYGAGATAYTLNSKATEEDAALFDTLFSAVGLAVRVEEKDIDAVVGVAGSSPAYVFAFIESLADGGVKMGLTRQMAMKLAAQTVLGSAKMVLESGVHPGELKDNVCSAGGATIAAMHELEKNCFRGTVISAVVAASERSKELSPVQKSAKL